MISVAEAEKIILSQVRAFGTESVALEKCVGRVLSEDILADRDMPPFDRVSMDGIAINYSAWSVTKATCPIESIASAGSPRQILKNPLACIEVMTGAVLPTNTDTVIRYEDLSIHGSAVTINEAVIPGQNIHVQGVDAKKDSILVPRNTRLHTGHINTLATVGRHHVQVMRLPAFAIIATGDELVGIKDLPKEHQIRTSNAYAIQNLLKAEGIRSTIFTSQDNPDQLSELLESLVEVFEAIILIGGVSAGKFDYVPNTLASIGINQLFHKIAQRPGKPLWFGVKENGPVVFALPGNPVSSFMCTTRYIIPWVKLQIGLDHRPILAYLSEPIHFNPALTYLALVNLFTEHGEVKAQPINGNGSGDLVSLGHANGFAQLPHDQTVFKAYTKIEVYPFSPPF